jgi:N-acetylmuramoyl-L-alanine amidase
VKTANFRVLRRNQYPAVLVECGFLSNRSEGTRCATSVHRERLATAIATAIVEHRHGREPAAPAATQVASN